MPKHIKNNFDLSHVNNPARFFSELLLRRLGKFERDSCACARWRMQWKCIFFVEAVGMMHIFSHSHFGGCVILSNSPQTASGRKTCILYMQEICKVFLEVCLSAFVCRLTKKEKGQRVVSLETRTNGHTFHMFNWPPKLKASTSPNTHFNHYVKAHIPPPVTPPQTPHPHLTRKNASGAWERNNLLTEADQTLQIPSVQI